MIKKYTSDSNYSFFKILRSVFDDYFRGNSLALRIAKRDLKAQYRQSVFGFTWALIIPIASTVLWVVLQKQGVINVSGLTIPYPVFVLTGVMLWQLFVDSLNSPLNMFKQSRNMINKINFPKEALILAGVYKLGFNFLIKLAILIAVYLYYGVFPDSEIFLFPIAVFAILLLGISVGILITPVGALYNDVQQFLQTFMRLFFFLTPVIYLSPSNGWLSIINRYNPIGILIDNCRSFMSAQPVDSYVPLLVILLCSFIIFIVASIIYKISMPIIVERTGA